MINLTNYKDLNEVKRLMAECMWADDERIQNEFNKYLEVDSRELSFQSVTIQQIWTSVKGKGSN